MKKIVFFNVPAHGHTNPTIPIVKALCKQGNEVYYFSGEEFKDNLDFPGLHFRAVNFDYLYEVLEKTFDNLIQLLPAAVKMSDRILSDHLDEIREIDPDLIMYDNTCIWGNAIAGILNKPSIGSFSIFVLNKSVIKTLKGYSMFSITKMLFKYNIFKQLKHFRNFKKLYKAYRKKHKLNKMKLSEIFAINSAVNLVYTIRDLQPAAELVEKKYRFVGPIIRESKKDISKYFKGMKSDKPLVYISLGTAVNNNLGFFKLCIETISKLGVNAIISCGSFFTRDNFNNVPDNVVIEPYVPQIQILGKSDLFITHGGMNSTHEGLYFGVPLIFIPQHDEQRLVGNQVAGQNAGLVLDTKSLSAPILKESISTVLKESSYKENAALLSDKFKKAGGLNTAINTINEITYDEE